MKLKTLALVVACLAVLSAVVFVVQRPGPPPSADPRIGQPLAAAAVLDRAARVSLSDQGKSVVLIKQADGSWRVPGYYDLKADFAKLTRLVGDLTGAKIQRLVSSNPETIGRLEFGDTRIAFLDAGEKELWSVTLGRNAENGGRFIRFGTEQKAYLTDFAGEPEADAKSWADARLLDLKAEDVARVELSFPDSGDAVVSASRAKKEDPFALAAADRNPPAGQLKPDAVSNVLNAFTQLSFTDTSNTDDPAAVAAKAHARLVKLGLFDGRTITIIIGRKPEEKIVKAPAPAADASKSGPASVLNAMQPAKAAEPSGAASPAGPEKALEPATETVPAGPVFAFISSSDPAAPVNALMQKRAFQIAEYVFTGLPQKPDEMFEPKPPAAAAPAAEKPAAPADRSPAQGAP